MDPELLALLFGNAPVIPGALPMVPPVEPPIVPPVAPLPVPTISPADRFGPGTTPYNEAYRSASMPAGPEAYRTEPMTQPGMTPTSGQMSLGAALEPQVPMPQPRPANAPGATPVAGAGSDALLKTLRGVQAPAAPVAQKVSTPHAPTIAKIQGGALADLLASLGIGPQQALPGLKLPSTLGQALGGR